MGFKQDQKAPEFLEWLTKQEELVDQFLAEDVPAVGALEDPWTAEALQLTEQAARDTFGERTALRLPENAATVDRFVRFIGEVYCHAIEGRWGNHPNSLHPMNPVILDGFTGQSLDPLGQLYLAFVTPPRHGRVNGELSWVFANYTTNYHNWDEAGRPSPVEWGKIRIARMVEQDRQYKANNM
jgi:hypothetical protein